MVILWYPNVLNQWNQNDLEVFICIIYVSIPISICLCLYLYLYLYIYFHSRLSDTATCCSRHISQLGTTRMFHPSGQGCKSAYGKFNPYIIYKHTFLPKTTYMSRYLDHHSPCKKAVLIWGSEIGGCHRQRNAFRGSKSQSLLGSADGFSTGVFPHVFDYIL